MAFADSNVKAEGAFFEEDHGIRFEWSKNPEYVEQCEDVTRFIMSKETDVTKLYPHLVWVLDEGHIMRKYMSPYRYAKVMKTRAHVVVDEDENGLVIEVWKFKNARRQLYGDIQG